MFKLNSTAEREIKDALSDQHTAMHTIWEDILYQQMKAVATVAIEYKVFQELEQGSTALGYSNQCMLLSLIKKRLKHLGYAYQCYCGDCNLTSNVSIDSTTYCWKDSPVHVIGNCRKCNTTYQMDVIR